MSLSTPVAFLIFNRPDLTQIVFKAIAKAEPKQLFVVADGPRSPEEMEKCAQARDIIGRVDWECEVFTNYSDKNLGCGRRVSSGIEWVFSEVEEAIFLEDDTLPDPSFFPYCESLLERYRYDERIMTINGNSFQLGSRRTEYSYHFTKYCSCWGWASWRRAWKHYDYEMKTWPLFKQTGMMKMICSDPCERRFWTSLFDTMHENPVAIDTWDHQWKYACWSQNGLSIEPSVNLVANIGLGRTDASHTCGYNPLLAELSKNQELREIKHPPFVVRHRDADRFLFDNIIGGKQMKENNSLFYRFRRGLRRFGKRSRRHSTDDHVQEKRTCRY
jgi:hypothetical protein